MSRLKRPELVGQAAQANRQLMAALGGEVRASRRRRRWTQAVLGTRVGVTRSTVSALELGKGGSLSLDVWQRTFLALERDLRFETTRNPRDEPADAGHLIVQELVLRLARNTGRQRAFELATRPAEPWRSADVGIRDDPNRVLILTECWNAIGDVGASARSTTRKMAEATQLAVAIGGDRPYRIAGVWVVRATKRNRQLLARYPEVFATRFPGSSAAWVRALTTGDVPPTEIGLVWADVSATRLFPWRRRSSRPRPRATG